VRQQLLLWLAGIIGAVMQGMPTLTVTGELHIIAVTTGSLITLTRQGVHSGKGIATRSRLQSERVGARVLELSSVAGEAQASALSSV